MERASQTGKEPTTATGRESKTPSSARGGLAAAIDPRSEVGNQALIRLQRAGLLQAKLMVSQPGDRDEEEADRVAERVARSPMSPSGCSCAAPSGNGDCTGCRSEALAVQRKPITGARPGAVPAAVSRDVVPSSGGRPLQAPVRASMETHFNADFEGVRVYTDAEAAASAATLDARAFTVGQNIVFGSGRYSPDTPDGKRLLAHELTHVVQQQRGVPPAAVQRDGNTPPSTPPAPETAPAPSAPPSPDAAKELAAQEEKAFETAKARKGQPAATVLFSNPNSPDTKASPVLETFTIAEVLDRQAGASGQRGFDAQGTATAYAGLMGTDVGGAALQQDRFFYAARLNKGEHKLRVLRATWTEADWWKVWRNDHVYRVTPAAGVVSVTGMAGFTFPLNTNLEDDPARNRFLKDPAMAVPADAESMRKIAGVRAEANNPNAPTSADEVAIPVDQQESFILGYFRARGLEALASNEKEAEALAQTFKPTNPGSEKEAASGVSAEVQGIIAADRELNTTYRDLLESEVQVEALLDFLRLCQERGEFPPFYPIYLKPQKTQVAAMATAIGKRQADIQQKKNRVLSASPLIGQLVGMPNPRDRFQPTSVDRVSIPWTAEIPKIYGANSASASLLGKPATNGGDEQIRGTFEKRLDAVRKAIRDARSEMLGDVDFLLGLDGLRHVVEQDLSALTGRNTGLKDTLRKILESHKNKDTGKEVLGIVVQVGLLFVPGGIFLSTLAGLAISGAQMAKDLRTWTVSQASVNPATALASQQQAEASLTRSTIDLAINAVFAATEAINALKAMEKAGAEKTLGAALEGMEASEAKIAAADASSVGSRALEGAAVEEELAANLEKMQPSDIPGYTHEIPVGGGHSWRRTSDGIWCRYSRTPTNCLAPKKGSLPEFLKKRFAEGENFNKENRPRYTFKEVEVYGEGGKIYRVDSFDREKEEIVSRRLTQLADVQETTAKSYLSEFTLKYPPGATITDSPFNPEKLRGQRLIGTMIFEVPVQVKPIPKSILDAAAEKDIVIRDVTGKIYK
jgi:hypothetical protein